MLQRARSAVTGPQTDDFYKIAAERLPRAWPDLVGCW
jgi:hypothetical protein